MFCIDKDLHAISPKARDTSNLWPDKALQILDTPLIDSGLIVFMLLPESCYFYVCQFVSSSFVGG